MHFTSVSVTAFLSAFALAGLLVVLTIKICRARGWVALPRPDRWHQGTPGLFGGVPIWVTFVSLGFALVPLADRLAWKVIAAATLVFLSGLADDVWGLRPRAKLLVQIVAAVWVVHAGGLYLFQNRTASWLIALLWIVGITNAFNLLDNMDGLAAGVGLIAALGLYLRYASQGPGENGLLLALAAGATGGFLLFNFNPARIFMGDSGSLFLGFMLANTSLLVLGHNPGLSPRTLAPVLLLAIPVLDTFFVSVTRRWRGQPVSQGGTDHCSHRLVRLGMSERQVVLLLYTLAAVSGAVVLTGLYLPPSHTLGLGLLWAFCLLLFGIHLFQPETLASENHGVSWIGTLLTRDTLAPLLDTLAFSLSFYLAYFLPLGEQGRAADVQRFFRMWPFVLGVKFSCACVFRVYRHSWWRGSGEDLYRLVKATLLGEVALILLLAGVHRFTGISPALLFYDAVFSCVLLLIVRKFSSLFRHAFKVWAPPVFIARRVFVLGTSPGTAQVLRYLRERRISCAGLIDTNGGADVGRWVWGAPVIAGLHDQRELDHPHDVSEIVSAEDEPMSCSEAELQQFCQRSSLSLVRLGLYPVEPE